MASTFKVEVVPVELVKHPDADRLSIAIVKGWECVVATEQFDGIKLGAYIPLDALLPRTDRFLSFFKDSMKERFRVKAVKLRGVISMGILIPAEPHWELGQDVKDELGITKYEEPEDVKFAGDNAKKKHDVKPWTIAWVKKFLRKWFGSWDSFKYNFKELLKGKMIVSTYFSRYTDIENIKNHMGTFKPGDEVIATEKVHGTNARFGWIDGDYMVGSHNQQKHPEGEHNVYSLISKKLGLKKLLKGKGNIIVFGEIYGPGIQKNFTYGATETKLIVFDIVREGRYLDYDEFEKLAKELGLETAPVIYRGPFDIAKIKELAELDSTVSTIPKSIREGLVVRGVTGHTILKHISTRYLMAKGNTEHH